MTETTVAGPPKPLLPAPILSYAAVVSSCEALVVDASSSTGSGGRYDRSGDRPKHLLIRLVHDPRACLPVYRSMYAYWIVESLSGVNTTLIDRYLSRVNPSKVGDTQALGARMKRAIGHMKDLQSVYRISD